MKKILIGIALLGGAAFAHAQGEDGAKIFNETCTGCHGVRGELSTRSPVAINTLTQQQIEGRLQRARVAENKNTMDKVGARLTEEQAKAVAEYVSSKLGK